CGQHGNARIGVDDPGNAAEIGRHADMDIGSSGLGGGFLEHGDGVQLHQFPSSLLSYMVERRPRRTISKRQASASMGVVLYRSSRAMSWSMAASSGMVATMGHCQSSGSPSKYIWVISLCAKAW